MTALPFQNTRHQKTGFFIFLPFLLSTLTMPAMAKVTCPASVKGGHPLAVAVTYENADCNNPLQIVNTLSSVIGNASGTAGMGSIGLHGPVVTATAIDLPAASCQPITVSCGNGCSYVSGENVVNATHTVSSFQVYGKTPASMEGSMVGVVMMVEDNNGNIKKVGQCYSNVTK